MASDVKHALITGASSGLGKATAIALAKSGYAVTLLVRDPARGEAACQDIRASVPGAVTDMVLADLSSQVSIRAFAAEFNRKYTKLDLLVNNAGNSFTRRLISPDGIEMSLAVNHLAPFLLTHLLLGLLQKGDRCRIVNVGTRLDTAIDFGDLQWEKRRYNGLLAYAQSKLGNLLFTLELAKRLAGSAITVNCVHPGVFRSNLGKNTGIPEPPLLKLLTGMAQPFLATAEQAAERVLFVATDPSLEGITGQYFGNRQPLPLPKQATDRTAIERLWKHSELLTHLASG